MERIRVPRALGRPPAWVMAVWLAPGCGEDQPGKSPPTTLDEGEPSACERPVVRVHVDVMSCKLLVDVRQRLEADVKPRLEQLFHEAPVTNSCDGRCGITLELKVATVTYCQEEVSRQEFIDGKVLAHRVASLRKRDPSARHVVWGVDFETEDGDRPSGYADDLDVIVALGELYRSEGLGPQQYAESEAAILMHELGHTFGLQHGNPGCSREDLVSRHCTRLPHHLSVMSYGWVSRGVGHGAGASGPEAWSPTYQGFRTKSIHERQGAVVEIDPQSPQCPAGALPEAAVQPWVAFYPDGADQLPRRVPIATPLSVGRVVDGTGVDLNGDDRKDQYYGGLPNEWEWIVSRRAHEPFTVDLYHRLSPLWAPLEWLGTDTDTDTPYDLDEPSVHTLIADLEPSMGKSQPGVPK